MEYIKNGNESAYFIFKPIHSSLTLKFLYNDTQVIPSAVNMQPKVWIARETHALVEIVKDYSNDVNWDEVSASLWDNHKIIANAMECLLHYRNVCNPDINKSEWESAEVEKLTQLAQYYNEHEWCTIAEELGTNRTPFQCLQYYQRNINSKINRFDDKWSEEEEAKLKSSVEVHGYDWSNVADDLPGRTPKQCCTRYRRSSHCNENVVNGHWLLEEERLLHFACISMNAPLSSSSKKSQEEIDAFLNHSYSSYEASSSSSSSSKKKSKNNHVDNEDEGNDNNIIGNFKGWTAVSALIPGKNDVQCREKWVNSIDPTIKHETFSAEEDANLLKLVEKLGAGHWTLIAKYMPGRSDNVVRNRYSKLTDQRKKAKL